MNWTAIYEGFMGNALFTIIGFFIGKIWIILSNRRLNKKFKSGTPAINITGVYDAWYSVSSSDCEKTYIHAEKIFVYKHLSGSYRGYLISETISDNPPDCWLGNVIQKENCEGPYLRIIGDFYAENCFSGFFRGYSKDTVGTFNFIIENKKGSCTLEGLWSGRLIEGLHSIKSGQWIWKQDITMSKKYNRFRLMLKKLAAL